MRAYIQAVPERRMNIESYLLPRLIKAGIFDSVEAVYDDDHKGPLFNFVQILERAKGSSAAVFQDDVVLSKHFDSSIPHIIEHLSVFEVISLFAPPRKDFLSFDPGVNFALHKKHLWQQGMLLSARVVDELLAFAMPQKDHVWHDDTVVAEYLARNKMKVAVTIPSMVQHNVNLASVAGNPQNMQGKPRITAQWPSTLQQDHFKDINAVEI
jgi:GR25 family glycosyltransferase involved in LPS biosynthesis